MNFNLDATRVFRLLKGNFRGIIKYTLAVMLCAFVFVSFLLCNTLLFKNGIVHRGYPIILGIVFIVLLLTAVFYFIGFNCEIIHNFIEEKGDFMPLAKGRFKEFIIKGGKAFFGSVIYFFALLVVFAIICLIAYFVSTNIAIPYDIVQFVNLALIALIYLAITPFFMAYAHTFETKSFFDKDNIMIFAYSYPEFIYSYVLYKVFNFAATILLILTLALVLTLLYMAISTVYLIGKALLVGVIISILLGTTFLGGLFIIFLVNTIAMLYVFSLNAQSYNYGKYFFFKGEAPKRKPIEIILPIALFIIMCIMALYADKLSNNFKAFIHENRSSIYGSVQNLLK